MSDRSEHPTAGAGDDDLDRVQAAFIEARELPAPDRAAHVEACDLTPAERRDVLELLAADRRPLDMDALVADGIAALAERPTRYPGELSRGDRIGPYEVIDRLGEGGFAIVHRAEQREPVRRTVAVKVLKPGMDSRAILARFEAERQALAVMEHPGIARVLDGGATHDGRPFFVMELVRGLPITQFADRDRLSLRERLELFARVCDAVQHAHQKGVIHRDLKPANILVESIDDAPHPKVIDFGIAKALAGPLTDLTIATRHGAMIGTPGYMAPEQIRGDGQAIDTRVDVHALGVVLYELLAGVLPTATPTPTPASELERATGGAAPARPSTRITESGDSEAVAKARRTEPSSLRRRLRRDLDWICLKAIAHEPRRRYDSASELAADVRRALADEMVIAGPPTLRYRLSAFTRRHRVEVACGLVLALGLAVAGSLVLRSAVAAANARDEQAAISGFLERFIVSASPFAREPIGGEGDGSRTDTLLARLEYALSIIDDELAPWPGAEADVRHTIAGALHGLGATERSAEEAGRAMDLAGALSPPNRRLELEAAALRGKCLWQLSRDDDAIDLLEPALDRARRRFGADDPTALGLANNLALSYRAVGRESEARALHADTLERRERALGPDHEDTVISRSNLARAFQATGQLDDALELQGQVLASHERTLGSDHPETLITADQLGTIYAELGRYDEAASMHRRARTGLAAALGETHESTLGARFYLARVLSRLGDRAAAEAELRAIWTICAERFGPDDRYATTSLISLADVLRARGRPEEAIAPLAEALAAVEAKDGWERPRTWGLARGLALARQDTGRHADALVLIEKIIGHADTMLAADDPRRIDLHLHRGVSLAALGRRDDAMAVLRPAIEDLEQRGITASIGLPRGMRALAGLLETDPAEATRLRARADRIDPPVSTEPASQTSDSLAP